MRPRPAGKRSQRSQALIEFALVSPVLLLLLFGIIDIGRAIFYYDTINHAAREGARVAVRASNQLPTDTDVLNAVSGQMLGAPVSAPCPQGPITGATPPANSAWVYITEPSPPGGVESTPPPNAPGGEYAAIGSRPAATSAPSRPRPRSSGPTSAFTPRQPAPPTGRPGQARGPLHAHIRMAPCSPTSRGRPVPRAAGSRSRPPGAFNCSSGGC